MEEERARYDLHIYKGATYCKTATFTIDDEPVDFTGCTVRSQIRKTLNGLLAVEFDIDVIPTEGVINLTLSAEQTLRLNPGKYIWDLKIVDADDITKYDIYGDVFVSGRATE